MSGWTIGEVRLRNRLGGELGPVPGWIRGDFAIDFRTYCDGSASGPCYYLSYVPFGMGINAFFNTLAEVQAFADDLTRRLCDWKAPAPVIVNGYASAPKELEQAVADAQRVHNLYALDGNYTFTPESFDSTVKEGAQ